MNYAKWLDDYLSERWQERNIEDINGDAISAKEITLPFKDYNDNPITINIFEYVDLYKLTDSGNTLAMIKDKHIIDEISRLLYNKEVYLQSYNEVSCWANKGDVSNLGEQLAFLIETLISINAVIKCRGEED